MNMNTIINEANRSKIQRMLDEVQAKAKVRTLNIEDVYNAVKALDDHRIAVGVAKAHCEGTIACFTRVEHIAKCYKGSPMSTHLRFEYTKGSWRLINIYRGNTAQTGRDYDVFWSEAAKADILKAASSFN